MCKVQGVIPTSYILQEKFLCDENGERHRGGFSEVRNGKYLGRAVAIKDLRLTVADRNKNFKVCLIHLA